MTRHEQLASITAAQAILRRWASDQNIPLHVIEYVVPFVETDFGLSTWIFYETDEQLRHAESIGWNDRIVNRLSEALGDLGYAPEWLSKIEFFFDSHESVVRDYEGNYFYRLR